MNHSRLPSRWYTRAQILHRAVPPALLDWLFDTSSLTARLQRQCQSQGQGRFKVEVLSQSIARPRLDELAALGLHYGSSALLREVKLYCADEAVVYARTVIPLTTLTGKQRLYAKLGNRPLGAMLFADRTMRRGEVMIAQLAVETAPLDKTVDAHDVVWGRRSVFRVSNKPLLVSEYFLPALFNRAIA
jgi:chorismate--pyruvate lyase